MIPTGYKQHPLVWQKIPGYHLTASCERPGCWSAHRARHRVARTARISLMFLLLIGIVWPASFLMAQQPGMPADNEPEAAPPPAPRDPLGRTTPKGFVHGLFEAMADQDFSRAARYFDLSGIPASRRDERGAELARAFKQLLDRGGWFAANWQLSDAPTGHLDDGLPPQKEKFATIRTPEGFVGMIAERIQGPDDHPIWMVSRESAQRIPDLLTLTGKGLVDRVLPESLAEGTRLLGVPLGHWAALLVIAIAAYVIAYVLTAIGVFFLLRIWRRTRGPRASRLIKAAILPFRIILALWVFAAGSLFLGISIVARQQMGPVLEIIAWVALGLLLWRIINAFAEIVMDRLSQRGQVSMLSAVRFFRRGAKFLIAAIAIIAALSSMGFDVTAGLAALGIGGLAIALGAQKTVENFVGSLTLVADQPMREGDFCRIGQVLGTIEDIGMRSTRIRTLDRTIVTVPNGELSSLQIENYNHRDRFWFHPKLALRYETTPDQIRYLLVELRKLLYSHPRVDSDPARVRFLGLGADSLTIEIFAYVHAEDYSDFLEVQEDLTLRIMDIVAESGASFAFPSQTIYMAEDHLPPEDKRQAAEKRVRRWRTDGDLQLPRFQPDLIGKLRNSLAYPPDGSASRVPAPSKTTDPSQPEQEMESPPPKGIWKWFKRRR